MIALDTILNSMMFQYQITFQITARKNLMFQYANSTK